MAKPKVYVAGALNAKDAIKYVRNLSRMFRYGVMLMESGYSVFVPGLDLLLLLSAKKINYNFVFYNSWEWIKVSDAVYVCPKSRRSKGTKREIKLAKKMGIPVFHKVSEMNKHFGLKGIKKVKLCSG